ncbi:hypothetical protein H0H81_009246 [Sphagnurus paluster]|uniref:Uncharacterized protein n=1 Tax=Sphagnurus paluster TaxID=117069 RepID=A0A9P7FRP6_9AGAR|nr:hypothetical protein H0H81_009246 [Sphagnurus paluster]
MVLAVSRSPPLFEGLKSLRHIHIDFTVPYAEVAPMPLSPNIPWSQLTSFDMSSESALLNFSDAAIILRQCRDLIELRIKIRGTAADLDTHSNLPIYLPFLRNMIIYGRLSLDPRHKPDLESLFDLLQVPALVCLEMIASHGIRPPLIASLVSVITRSRCKLEVLRISNYVRQKLTQHELEKLLVLLPDVRVLHTKAIHYGKGILHSMLQGEILVMLEDWSFHGSVSSIDLFDEIIQARGHARKAVRGVLVKAVMYNDQSPIEFDSQTQELDRRSKK